MLASQVQNGEKISYNVDPSERVRETISAGTTASDVTSHYAGPGDSPAWTVDTENSVLRYIPGLDGGLAAIQTKASSPILQIENLHGDIIATASMSPTATKLSSTSDTTEYGVPRATPAKYSWLGAAQRPTELPTGIIGMGARGYIPQLGRFEQTDPQSGGSANAYTYTNGDPVNNSDPSGEYTITTTFDISNAGTGPGTPYTEHEIEPGAIMPQPVNQELEHAYLAGASGGGTDQDLPRLLAHPATGCTDIHAPCAHRKGPAPPPENSSTCRSGGGRDSHGNCKPKTGGSQSQCFVKGAEGAAGGAIGGAALGGLMGDSDSDGAGAGAGIGAVGGAIGGCAVGILEILAGIA
jgi:RHS repeat-associated protein